MISFIFAIPNKTTKELRSHEEKREHKERITHDTAIVMNYSYGIRLSKGSY